MLRCPLCADFSHTPLANGFVRCTLCSLAFPADPATVLHEIETYYVRGQGFFFPNWNNWLFRSTRHGLRFGLHGDNIYFSPTAVRMYAAKQGLRVTSLETNLPFIPVFLPSWRFGRTIKAETEGVSPPRLGADRRLTLGIITTAEAWSEAVELCRDMSGYACEAVVVLDTHDSQLASDKEALLQAALDGGMLPMRARVLASRLNRNFAAQRNRIQEAARTAWVIQLDSDERLTLAAKRLLTAIMDDAEGNGWSAVALPRRNLVDGVLSALYPDVQYRLIQKDVRFVRPVHEYPDLRGRTSFVFLSAEILHQVDGLRLTSREALYEGIRNGAGRPHDTALLRTPLETGISLPATDVGTPHALGV